MQLANHALIQVQHLELSVFVEPAEQHFLVVASCQIVERKVEEAQSLRFGQSHSNHLVQIFDPHACPGQV